MRCLIPLALLLVAGSASAQEEEEALTPLNGVGRITIQGGWRLSSNGTFYDSFYALPDYQGVERAPISPGGPLRGGLLRLRRHGPHRAGDRSLRHRRAA